MNPRPRLAAFLCLAALVAFLPRIPALGASCLYIPTHAELDEQMAYLVTRVRENPDDRSGWMQLLVFVTLRTGKELADARQTSLRTWELDPRLEDPDEVRAIYASELEEWRRRSLEALPGSDCELGRRLEESPPRQTAAQILTLPLPDQASEVECRADRLWSMGEREAARSLALRFRDSDPSRTEHHRPLLHVLGRFEIETGDAEPRLRALQAQAASVPNDPEVRRWLLSAYRGEGLEAELEALYAELWNGAASDDERLSLCDAVHIDNEDVDCYRDLFALAGETSSAGLTALERIYRMTVYGDVANGLPAWLELASPEAAFESWDRILPEPDACALFLERVERGDYDHLEPSEDDPAHPAARVARWLGECRLSEAESDWRERGTTLWGKAALAWPTPEPPPDERSWAQKRADEGLEALAAGNAALAAGIGAEIFEARRDLTHRERSAGRYLLGRAAVLEERWADAADLLEPFFLDRLRFTGFRDHIAVDRPYRRLLARLGIERLRGYHARSLQAERHYLQYLATGAEREAAEADYFALWRVCDTLHCANAQSEEFDDRATLQPRGLSR